MIISSKSIFNHFSESRFLNLKIFFIDQIKNGLTLIRFVHLTRLTWCSLLVVAKLQNSVVGPLLLPLTVILI